uniref:Uncharacterized protein n=1 Tax=Arundo donax TaxID=35708 RepID=A0A0A9GU54_ARUDO
MVNAHRRLTQLQTPPPSQHSTKINLQGRATRAIHTQFTHITRIASIHTRATTRPCPMPAASTQKRPPI